MSRKKQRYRDKQPKTDTPEQTSAEIEQQVTEVEQKITRYKAVVRSPIGEWWYTNKKRVRLFAMIGGGGVFVGWLLFELFNFIF